MLKVTVKHPNGQNEATYDVATEYNRIYDTLQEYHDEEECLAMKM